MDMISGGLGSQPEMEAGSRQWKHQILALRPVVSDKGLALWLCRESPQRWKVVKQVKYSLSEKKSIVYVDRHMGRLRESP